MATTHFSPGHSKEFDHNVQEIAKKFQGDVLRIRHSFGYDWSGDPAVFFRVVHSDDASREERLGAITQQIRRELFDDLGFADSEYFPYVEYRSKAEQDKLQDPE